MFQVGNDMTFDGDVIMAGTADACNVYWQIGRDATIAADSQFKGTLIASRDISLVSGADVVGRLMALNSSLTTDGNTITGCASSSANITVVKTVVNDNGRTLVVANFPLFVNGTPVTSGVTNGFAPGLNTVTETSNSNYTVTFSGDCDVNGVVDLSTGESAVCIVTNDDVPSSSSGGSSTPPVPPLIEVVKVPSPLALPGGPGPVTYTYTLRNIGTVSATNITMVGDTCSPLTLVSGDTNSNAVLEVSETWTYTCSTTLTETHTNTVTATGWANGISSVDIASATVVVGGPVPPLIHVTKVPSPLALLAGGGMVTYTKRITNPGTVTLSNVRLTDDQCSPLTYISGDTNANSMLETSETWTYTCQRNLTRTTTNTAIATGEANGMVARDFAVATVVVAGTFAGLPSTGFAPTESVFTWSVLAAGILAVSLLFYVIRKRQTA